ncbi:putative baseplate assembly protein GpJ [Bradyrhizobium oligotrophicum S58]|uniref:Putative baseplate assembly protein GpJ n=1 Tax=Bradyrhizobium oligotrophicum S58 TaxID=1245469 RepID=M4ZN92_9BRAD|nr:baseplate J/gp47 family protein [Bradyrhizobium oligotrophicum]BAM87685.1 putative baseplate assembly protein GpJ [Bradyrhizobium oligotrophicum S58]
MDAPLPNIPLPVIEREPAFETLFNNRLVQLRGLLADAGFDWDTYILRSDPLNRFCRHAAYGDLLMVSAMNDTFRATLTDFAQGADLIALASDWNLTQADGEAIDDLRRRLRETKKGQGGFTDNWYKRHAFAADPLRVDDVGVEGDAKGGVLVSILSKDNGGVASDDLLATVEAALNQPGVRGDNDHITVVRAVILTVNVEADVWLLPEATKETTMAASKAALVANFAAERRLGWDFASDFAVAALRTVGVKRVSLVAPASNSVVVTAGNEAVALGTIELNYKGRAY